MRELRRCGYTHCIGREIGPMRQQARRLSNMDGEFAGSTAATNATANLPTPEPFAITLDSLEIQRLAYQYWMERGSPEGSPEQDWYRAEADLLALTAVTAASANFGGSRSRRASAGN